MSTEKKKSFREKSKSILSLVILILSFSIISISSVTALDVTEIKGQPVPEKIQPNACEVHVGFNYDLPVDPKTWTFSAIFQSGAADVEAFIDRVADLKQSRPIYVYAFTSWEGGYAYNQALAQRRAEAVVDLMKRYVASKNLEDITINVAIAGAESKSEAFWTISNEEKEAIDAFATTKPDSAKMNQVFDSLPALKENRRAVLVLDKKQYSIVQLNGPSKLIDIGCPKPPEPGCGNGVVDRGEECDPGVRDSCAFKGEGYICGEPKTSGECTCLGGPTQNATAPPTGEGGGGFSWYYLLPLLLLPFLIWFYRTKRLASKKREITAADLDTKKEICKFLAALIETKKETITSIRGLEEKIAALDPHVRKDFAEYVKNFRDVAFLRDESSQEAKMLDKAGEEVKEVFEDYLALISLLLELESLEATLIKLVGKLKTGCAEFRQTGNSETFNKLGIPLTAESANLLEQSILPKLETESKKTLDELAKIEKTVEEHVREMGLLISGVTSAIFHNRWKKKFIEEYGEGGEEAFKELWWAKRNMKFGAPIYLRGEKKPEEKGLSLLSRTGERHIWHFRTEKHRPIYKYLPVGKWDHDKEITTTEGSPEEQQWKQRLNTILGSKDVVAKSAYIQKLGTDVALNIDKDVHVLSGLFKIVSVKDESQIAGIEQTGKLKGMNEKQIEKHGFMYGGSLQEQMTELVMLAETLCKAKSPSVVTPPRRPAFDYPQPPTNEILQNISKIKTIVAGTTVSGVHVGLVNYAPQVISSLKKEIEEHLNEINEFRKNNDYTGKKRAQMVELITKRSRPIGLNDYKNKRFYGYIDPNKYFSKMRLSAPLEIVAIEKFVFGSDRVLITGYNGGQYKGKAGKEGEGTAEDILTQPNFSMQTEGIGVGRFLGLIFSSNVAALRQLMAIIDEKEKLLTTYVLKITEYEKNISKLADEAANRGDDELFTIYENMLSCFKSIREQIIGHGALNTFRDVRSYFDGIVNFNKGEKDVVFEDETLKKAFNVTDYKSFENSILKRMGKRISSSDPELDHLICSIYSWKVTVKENWDDVHMLEDAFNALLENLRVHSSMIVESLQHINAITEQNYERLRADIERYHAIMQSRERKAA